MHHNMNDFCARAKEILQQGDSMLAAAKSRIGPISADSYLYMYAYHVFREDHSILGFVTLMEKADLLRNEINEALLAILRANPEQLERSDNISTIKALSRMRTELDAMKRKASVQSLAEFVDQVTNEGSILNLV